MRSNVAGRLWEYFQEFLAGSTGEEQRLMLDVMESWESSSAPIGTATVNVDLAEAFSYQISARKYLKVPLRHEKLVERYIALLDQTEAGNAA